MNFMNIMVSVKAIINLLYAEYLRNNAANT